MLPGEKLQDVSYSQPPYENTFVPFAYPKRYIAYLCWNLATAYCLVKLHSIVLHQVIC
jgi:hypothetical protein